MASGESSQFRGWYVSMLILLVASLGTNLYLGLRMEEDRRVFGKIYDLLESGMNDQLMDAMTQVATIQRELGQLREQIDATAGGMVSVDDRMKLAEDRLLERVKEELPPLLDAHLDRLLAARVDQLKDSLAQEAVREQLREDVREILREEMERQRGSSEP